MYWDCNIVLFQPLEKDPYCCDKFPINHEEQVYVLQQKWNKVVTSVFSNAAKVPLFLGKKVHEIYCRAVNSKDCEINASPKSDECGPCN